MGIGEDDKAPAPQKVIQACVSWYGIESDPGDVLATMLGLADMLPV
jgi:hypothetical protein